MTVTGVSRRLMRAESPDVGYLQLHELDFSSLASAIEDIRPDVVIHAAAEGSVDAVEADPFKYRYVNETLPGQLAELTQTRAIQFVYLSSNAVYGEQVAPWNEKSAQSPINSYGELKRMAEIHVSEANSNALIVRPIMMYGWPLDSGRDNPVSFWIKRLSSGQSVSVVSDVETQPLYAGDCAASIWMAIQKELKGSLNISGGSTLSLFEFARVSADVFEFDLKNVHAISARDLKGLAPRPTLTEFDLSKLTKVLEFNPYEPAAGLRIMRNEAH